MISIQTLAIILLSAFGVVILAASFVITYIIAKRRTKNNPNNAIVILRNGQEGEAFKAKLHKISRLGYRYIYKANGKIKHVILPKKYEPFYVRNNLWIFIRDIGDIVSSPFHEKDKLSDAEREELIYEVVETHIASDGMRALKGGKGINTALIIIIIIAAIVLGGFGIQFIQKQSAQQAAQVLPPPVTQPIEVK